MKNKMKRFIRICVIIWGVLVSLSIAMDVVKYISGGYVEVDATITYVHYFKDSGKYNSYYRANGDLIWEYEGDIFESEELIDLPADAEEGDTKTIWIDAETGEYANFQGVGYAIFCCVVNALFCAMILKFVKVKKE